MAPENIREVGKLVSLEPFSLTDAAVQVSTTSRITMAVSIQADAGNANRIAARDIYTIQVGDANNVYMRTVSGAATANVLLIVPPGSG
jgi:hypothetical protein